MVRRNNAEQVVVDSAPVIEDPMGALFGKPNSPEVNEESDMPDDIRALFESEGLYKKGYSCMLAELPGGVEDSNKLYLESFRRTFPSVDRVGNEYGPGTYRLTFMWDGTDEETGKKKKRSDFFTYQISEKYREKYKEYQRRQRILRAKEHNEELRNARVDKTLEDDVMDFYGTKKDSEKQQNPKEYLQELMQTVESLGLIKRGPDWASLLAAAAPFIPALISVISDRSRNAQNRQDEMMKLLIATMSSSNKQVVDVITNQQTQASGAGMFQEMKSMFLGAIDMKEALNPSRETVADRIFGMIENVAPKLVEFAAMSAQQKAQPMNAMQIAGAKAYMGASPDFQAVEKDPEEMAKLVNKLDSFYGWEQTDAILLVAEKVRPEECPRRDSNKYPSGDPRNGGMQNQAEDAQFTEGEDDEQTEAYQQSGES